MAAAAGPYYEHQVRLYRDGLDTPWGFRIQGGKDLNTPLTIQRVFVGSPAEGELHRGDIVVAIENQDAANFLHRQAQEIFKSSGGSLSMRIKRGTVTASKSKPPQPAFPQSFTSRPPGPSPGTFAPSPSATASMAQRPGAGVGFQPPRPQFAPQFVPQQQPRQAPRPLVVSHVKSPKPAPEDMMTQKPQQPMNDIVWQSRSDEVDDAPYEAKPVHELKRQFLKLESQPSKPVAARILRQPKPQPTPPRVQPPQPAPNPPLQPRSPHHQPQPSFQHQQQKSYDQTDFRQQQPQPIYQQQQQQPLYQSQQSREQPVYQQQPSHEQPAHQRQQSREQPVYQQQQSREKPAYQQQPSREQPAYQQQQSREQPAYQHQQSREQPAYQQQQSLEQPVYQQQQSREQPAYQQQQSREQPAYQQQQSREQPAYQQQQSREQPAYQQQQSREQPVYQQQQSREQPAYQQQQSREQPVYQQQQSREQPAYQQQQSREQAPASPAQQPVHDRQPSREQPEYGRQTSVGYQEPAGGAKEQVYSEESAAEEVFCTTPVSQLRKQFVPPPEKPVRRPPHQQPQKPIWEKPRSDSPPSSLTDPGWCPQSLQKTWRPVSPARPALQHQPKPTPKPAPQPAVNSGGPAWSGSLRSASGSKPWEESRAPPPAKQVQFQPGAAAAAQVHTPRHQNVHYAPGQAPQYQQMQQQPQQQQQQQQQPEDNNARVVHLQYNSPIGLYSKTSAEEVLVGQTTGQPGQGSMQIQGGGQVKEFDPSKSSVLRLLQEEQRGYGKQTKPQQQQYGAPQQQNGGYPGSLTHAHGPRFVQNEEEYGASEF